jgi:Flp pilus assembly protein TadG
MKVLESEDGASAVEFAIVLSVLMLLLFGVVQLSLAFHRSQGLEAAAREGARLASVGATNAQILDRIRESQSLFKASDVQVTVKVTTAGGTTITVASSSQRPCVVAGTGGLVSVTAVVPEKTDYAVIIPLWGNQKIRYTATGKFRCEKTTP